MGASVQPGRSLQAQRVTVSGIITCCNEETHIAACLESLDWCDEIIVVDSFSTDRTPEIALAHPKVRFFQHEYFGDGAQKNWGINQATSEWVLILDADERCSAALREEIETRLSGPAPHDGYNIRRRCYFLGRVLRFSGWQHDRAVRLVRRGKGYYANRRVHAGMVTVRPVPVLRQPLEHFMIECFHGYVQRINLYSYWGAAQGWRDRKRSGLVQVLVRPLWRFFRGYVVQLGILDGLRGLTFCALQAYASYLKWSLLWSWYENAERGRQPALPPFEEDPAVWSGLDRIRAARRFGRGTAMATPGMRPASWASNDAK